ncbi:hypothetical protein HPULCUR_011434 [Helicostylum pulchrum]|uniref:Uncharacterized protein n=1 Tax=Helicostylum pulchrum TaxID=562976 RepID=A0ABP9YG31_9FUNG
MELFKISSIDDIGIDKLPNLVKIEQVGEMGLTTKYLDPIFSPMFHQPEIDRHFVWTNRKDQNTENARPDGVLRLVRQKYSSVTLGFCEVKPADCKKSSLLCSDLLRLGTFSKTVLLRKLV